MIAFFELLFVAVVAAALFIAGKANKGKSANEELKAKNRELFFREKETLDILLAHHAITQAEHERSMRVLVEKLGMNDREDLDAGQVEAGDNSLD